MHLPPPSLSVGAETPADRLAARLAEELAARWRRGDRCRAEEWLAQHPELAEHPRAAVRLIYEEVCQRQELGQEVSAAELHARFPRWHQELDLLLECQRLLGLGSRFPEAGEDLGEFRLLAELGRGGLGRVFLAEQSFLAGRLTVLKVTPCAGGEHLALARLQHTHIVPLYAVRDFPERDLRVLCMPCLGGTTLDRILRRLDGLPPGQRTGADLRRALGEATPDGRMCWPGRGSGWKYLERASYVEAVCWVGLCIAEALHHAHEQGMVHLDLKPSNVLLTADGMPMLLDFHLARGPVSAGTTPEWLGGTPGYMSPEQRAAWQAARDGRAAPAAVDGRSDVWSLGLVLAETLGGGSPRTESDRPPLADRDLQHLPAGLRDVLARAVRPDPASRYPSTAALAEDLRRHLTNQPLAGVRNRSLRERWRKWRRRRPHALTVAGLRLVAAAAVVTLVVLAVGHWRHRGSEAEAALVEGTQHLAHREYAEAAVLLERGASLAEGLPGAGALAEELHRQHRRAVRGRQARALHAEVERLRYHYADNSPPATLAALEERCGKAWAGRAALLDHSAAPLEKKEEEQLRTDLLDVAVLWTDFHLRRAGTDGAAARREALDLLTEAELLLQPGAALARELRALGGKAGEREPQTAWEHYAVGRWLLRSGDLDGAAAALGRAIALQPGDFWPWYYSGLCAYRQRRWDDAVTAFTACVALAPRSAECYHNRALAYEARGQPEQALADYTYALGIDPNLAAAALNRGVLHLRENRLTEATQDLERALSRGADPAAVHYNLALVYQARHDRAAAVASVEEALRYRPDHPEARELRQRLRASRP
jgi:serine/threonine protein kinase/tetratricopeptide (TPR) repeat protein